MKLNLAKYENMKICVALSGGMDSMALLHYLLNEGEKFSIEVTALNCEHGIRGERSQSDSAFVKEYCKNAGVPLLCFETSCIKLAKERGVSVETAARDWRRECYAEAIKNGADVVATAHHLDDNAETVLFNIARGSAIGGAQGITDTSYIVNGIEVKLIRPLIECRKSEIKDYVLNSGVPYVEDESNESDDYTRNYIRHKVLPELERAVPGASGALYRFSRLAAIDEEYFKEEISRRKLINYEYGYVINHCIERALFGRAVVCVLKDKLKKKDYTQEISDRLYNLQFSEVGKKFCFLSLTAYKEEGRIVIVEDGKSPDEQKFCLKDARFGEFALTICRDKLNLNGFKELKFDASAVPESAVIRTRREGDRFEKFGGGSKSLGDYFTDKKVALRLRDRLPVLAAGSDILMIFGVEISEKIKVKPSTKDIWYAYMTEINIKE